MSTSEIATVLAWHDAVNSNDIDTLVQLSSDDIVLPTPDDDPDQGLDELREWATTAGVTLQPGRLFVHHGIVVVEETRPGRPIRGLATRRSPSGWSTTRWSPSSATPISARPSRRPD